MKRPPGNLRAYWSIPEVAERLGVGQVKVRRWLADGELGNPINIALHTRGRARLMVSIEAVKAFEERRQEIMSAPVRPFRRRRPLPPIPDYVGESLKEAKARMEKRAARLQQRAANQKRG